mmetsp:Transcript_1458/g.4338  ORF Transcript_1458/g.4338 Transcript_1458/m.4338 type:complete len:233 (+) Transcript_1458:1178-1876(+)
MAHLRSRRRLGPHRVQDRPPPRHHLPRRRRPALRLHLRPRTQRHPRHPRRRLHLQAHLRHNILHHLVRQLRRPAQRLRHLPLRLRGCALRPQLQIAPPTTPHTQAALPSRTPRCLTDAFSVPRSTRPSIPSDRLALHTHTHTRRRCRSPHHPPLLSAAASSPSASSSSSSGGLPAPDSCGRQPAPTQIHPQRRPANSHRAIADFAVAAPRSATPPSPHGRLGRLLCVCDIVD